MLAPEEATARDAHGLVDVLGALPVGAVVLGADGRVLVWNPAAEDLTGWPSTLVLGRPLLESTRVDLPTVTRVLAEVAAGRPFAGRLPAQPPSGRSLYLRAVPGPDGTCVGVLQDVADTRAEDEAFALLDALWETAPVGLAYVDTALRYRRVNGAVLERHGGSDDERLGRSLEEVHGPLGQQIATLLGEVVADGRPRHDVPVRGRLWHGTGEDREWRMYLYPVRDRRGVIVGAGMVVFDVTDAERTRRELAAVAVEHERALNRYQSLVEATSAAVWTRGADGSATVDAPGLRAITGQSAEAMSGWGFLDTVHPDDREGFAQAWRAAAVADPPEAFSAVHRLRTADGTHRWFRTRAVPVRAGGRVAEWVGTETDVDDEVRARARRDVLAGATQAMAAAREPEAELRALADATVPAFADICRVYRLDPTPLRPAGAGPSAVTGRRSFTRVADGIAAPSAQARLAVGAEHPIARCAHDRAPLLIDVVAGPVPPWSTGAMRSGWTEQIGATSMLFAPVLVRGEVVAVLLFLACGDRARYGEADVSLVVELAERASAAVDAAEANQRSRRVSLALQASMLTDPPRHPGLEVEVRYLPATVGMAVGGDWYDAFPLPGGDLAIGVGDVVGHDLPAAAAMGQLRSMLRGIAHDSDGTPADVVTRLDRVACGLAVTRFTTLIYGRISVRAGRTMFRWSNAGHPPPVLVANGEARVLPGVDVVLGVDPTTARHDREIELPPGATLLLHTDGLIERRSDTDDDATATLLDVVLDAAALPLGTFCDRVLRGSAADTDDDVALLALRAVPG